MIGWIRRIGASSERLLRVSAFITLVALALMMWSLLDPSVWPVMVAMSVAQGLGTLALAMFLFVVVRDVRRGRTAKDVE